MLEILGKIGFDWQVALANLVNFIIIFFLLSKFAFKPIQKVINERQKKIDEGLENAKRAETELFQAEALRKKKLEEAKREANQIIGDSQIKAEDIVAKSKSDGEAEKASIISSGEKQIEQKREMLKKDLEKETAELIVFGVEKVLRESFSEEDQKKYIKKVLVN